MKRVLIIEDNEKTRHTLKEMLNDIRSDVCIYETDNVMEAYGLAMKNDICLFLVDIVLAGEDRVRNAAGAEFINNIRCVDRYRFTPIIVLSGLIDHNLILYTTAHIYKFIEKPFDIEKTKKLMSEALMYRCKKRKVHNLYYPIDGLLESVEVDSIVYAQSINHNIHVVSRDSHLDIPYMTCKEFLKDVNDDRFVQCHRSTIVNIEYIKSINSKEKSIALYKCDDILPLGMVYKKGILKRFGEVYELKKVPLNKN